MICSLRKVELALARSAKPPPSPLAPLDLLLRQSDIVPCPEHPPHPVKDRRSEHTNNEQRFRIAQWGKRRCDKHVRTVAGRGCMAFLCRISSGISRDEKHMLPRRSDTLRWGSASINGKPEDGAGPERSQSRLRGHAVRLRGKEDEALRGMRVPRLRHLVSRSGRLLDLDHGAEGGRVVGLEQRRTRPPARAARSQSASVSYTNRCTVRGSISLPRPA